MTDCTIHLSSLVNKGREGLRRTGPRAHGNAAINGTAAGRAAGAGGAAACFLLRQRPRQSLVGVEV